MAMRYLFVLNHAFYLRNYGGVLLALSEAGHDIDVTFTSRRSGDAELFGRVFAGHGNVRLLPPPERTGWWWAAADPLRALRDYVHYLQPAFDDTPKLVERAARRVPKLFRAIAGKRGSSSARRRFFDRLLAYLERTMPVDPGVSRWLAAHPADAVLLSPLIEFTYEQTHILKAAKRHGTPTGHLVASWDNLSNKGRIQIAADRCFVWNRFQEQEARELHDLALERIVVTGAQLYDHWFAMTTREDRAAFCARLGLDPSLPIILYACSSPFICPNEVAFVGRWLRAIRIAADPSLRAAQIVIRPHPIHAEQWQEADLSALGPVVLSPLAGAAPIEEPDRQLFFDTLTHAAMVVGINTSLFLEAGIVGRRCLSVRSAEFDASQSGTLHFRYLTSGGLVDLAPDMDAHVTALTEALSDDAPSPEAKAFIADFVRPHGLDRPAVPIVADAVADLAGMKVSRERAPFLTPLIRALLFPIAALYLRPRYLARRAQRPQRHGGAVAAQIEAPASRQGRP